MRRLLPLLVLLTAVPVLAQTAQTVRFDPPDPTTRTPVLMTINGLWGTGCPPLSGTSTVTGNTITVRLTTSQHPCPILPIRPVEYQVTVDLGIIERADIYRVVATLAADPSQTVAEAKLLVREASPVLTVSPNVIFQRPATVRIRAAGIGTCPPNVSPCLQPVLRVQFNGTDSPSVRIISSDEIEAVVPVTDMVAPSDIYTVVVMTDDGRRLESFGALAFTSPNGLADPALFEAVMLPVIFAGPGAYGSNWTTEVLIENGGDDRVTLFRTPVRVLCPIPEGCLRDFLDPGEIATIDPSYPTGLYVHASRGNELRYNVLVKDLSRQSEALGTEIPVVREDDWSASTVHLLNIPSDSRFRTALRVYSDSQTTLPAIVVPLRVYRMGSNVPLVDTAIPLDIAHNGKIPSTNWIADLTRQLNIGPGDPLRIELDPPLSKDRIWAFASITNNDTQHVTVISPQ